MLRVTQQRVSQLHRNGAIVGEADINGATRFDRGSVEAYAAERARKKADREALADERAVRAAEAHDRATRRRAEAEAHALARQQRDDELKERAVKALEQLAAAARRAVNS